ncbi:MAG: hypothetical protein ACTSUT_14125 [Promethearchaeota archaeon]
MLTWKLNSLERETECIYYFIKNHRNIFERDNPIKVKIPKHLIDKIINGYFSDVKKELLDFLFEEYYKEKNLIKKGDLQKLSRLWKQKENQIFNEFERITNIKMENKNYTIYLGVLVNFGTYNTKTNSVIVPYRLNKMDEILYIVAHEIFHIYYFNTICKDNLTKNGYSSWLLSEIVVVLVSNEMKGIWGEKIPFLEETKEFVENIIPLWDNRTSFQEFIENSLNVIAK